MLDDAPADGGESAELSTCPEGGRRPDAGLPCRYDSFLRAPVTLPGEGRMRFGASFRWHISRFTS